MPHTLTLEYGDFAVLKLAPDAPIPTWLPTTHFWTVTRAADELSIICPTEAVPYGTRFDGDWRLLRMEGPFAFDLSGVLASVLTPLAAANVGIMAISSFNTDYVLVKHSRLLTALDALRAAGHTVLET